MRHLTTLRFIDRVAKVRSIRKAAELLAITPSALNRRILLIEEEIGAPIFERMSRGVRLNTAGEIFIRHIRDQLSDFERVQSQIADLKGFRRGHITIACPQPLLRFFLPFEIEKYRSEHQAVTFDVLVRNGLEAEKALEDHSADIAILAEAPVLAGFETILEFDQSIYGILPIGHRLSNAKVLRPQECFQYPLALPREPSTLRFMLERCALKNNCTLNSMVESDSFEFLLNFVREGRLVSFYIPIGLPRGEDLQGVVTRPLHGSNLKPLKLYLGQLSKRSLPIASIRFVEQITNAINKAYRKA